MNKNILEKICLGIIFTAIVATLFIPLIADNNFFFPFIFPKVITFRLMVSVMFLAYLFLVYLNANFRPKFSLIFLSALAFVVIAFISSFFGPDFRLSFWGDIERGEGLILWLHLLVYFIVLFNVIKSQEIWHYLLEFSLFSSLLLSIYGLGQAMDLEFVLSTAGVRVSSTVGNPAFLAAYLFFQIAFASYLFSVRKNLLLKAYYVFLIGFFSYIIFATQTRGALIGLMAGFLVASALLILKSKNKPVKTMSLSLVFLIFLSIFTLYAFKDSQIVKTTRLNSAASIFNYHNEKTFKTRVMAWEAAWKGFKEKPVFGYGLESYNKVFDKNFPPLLYERAGSQVWFDRAHNVFFDRLITVGILGFLAYLAFVLLPAIYLFFWLFRKDNLENNEQKAKKTFAIVFIGLTVGFLIQNLAVFETITTYIILFFTWAFLAKILEKDIFKFSFYWAKGIWLVGFVFCLIAIGPLTWFVNIKPAQANLQVAKAMHMSKIMDQPPENYSFFDIVDQFKVGLEMETYGNPEYQIQFIDFIGTTLANLGEVVDSVKTIIVYTDEMVEKQINMQPSNSKNYLVAMRHYNYTFASLPDDKFERLNRSLSFFPKFAELSPTRPHVYQEAGYTNLYKYRNYVQIGEDDLAAEALKEAEKYFEKTIELNSNVVESYINLIMLYLNSSQDDEIYEVIARMEENEVSYKNEFYLTNMLQLAGANQNYKLAVHLSEKLIEINPDELGLWNNLAVAYAYLDQKNKAIQTAEKMRKVFSNITGLDREIDTFIQEVQEGKYKLE